MQKSPEERFIEIAPKRVDRVIVSINSLSKCSTRNYKYSREQVNKMFKAIKNELMIAEEKFKPSTKSKNGFRF
jgi:hypothetical protein